MSDVLAAVSPTKHRKMKRSELIPKLQHIQEENGYLSKESLEALSTELGIPLSSIYGVATFYTQFRFTPLGKYVIKVCHGTACHVNGANEISETVTEVLGIKEGETTPDGLATIERVACLGCCSLSPVIMVNGRVYGKLTSDIVRDVLTKLKRGELDD